MQTTTIKFTTDSAALPLTYTARAAHTDAVRDAVVSSVARRLRAREVVGGHWDGLYYRATYVTRSGQRHEVGVKF